MRISDWRSDVCSSDLLPHLPRLRAVQRRMQRELDDRDSAAADGRDGINDGARRRPRDALGGAAAARAVHDRRSEEHTSELQSLMRISYAVFCLKKKKY